MIFLRVLYEESVDLQRTPLVLQLPTTGVIMPAKWADQLTIGQSKILHMSTVEFTMLTKVFTAGAV